MNPLPHLFLWALLSAPPRAAQDGAPPQQTAEQVPRVWSAPERAAIDLLRGLRKKVRPPDDELAARLAGSGEVLLPFLFEVLEARKVPAHDEGKVQILSEIQENVILLIASSAGPDGIIRPLSPFRPGDRVQITGGPLAGLVAIIQHPCSQRGRVKILLDFLRQGASVELPVELVDRV